MVKPSELKKWMDKNEKSTVDVASLTHVSEKTVQRFLKGEVETQPIVLEAFKRLLTTPPEDCL